MEYRGLGWWGGEYRPSRAVDPHSFLGDPDPVVLLNADPDPAA